MPKHHLIISGTGRAGTTFLTQLLTKIGMDTGFPDASSGIHTSCNAGMEWNIKSPDAPYVVKSPAIGRELEELLGAGKIIVDYAIIPIRELYASAESRRTVQRKWKKRGTPGGLMLSKNPHRQEAILAEQFHILVHTLTKYDVPMIWLHFPRLVKDVSYVFEKFKPFLPSQDKEIFSQAFQTVSRPELIHDFSKQSPNKRSFLERIKLKLQQ